MRKAIGIFDITAGIGTVAWLCAEDEAKRKQNGWTVKRLGDVDGECGDCRVRVDGSAIGPPTTRTHEATKEKAA